MDSGLITAALVAQDAGAGAAKMGGDGFPAPVAVIFSFICFFFAFKFYAKFLSEKLFGLETDDGPTPATRFEDGVDYVPTKKSVIFGHHFTSVAGAAPIVGPALAVVYGWLPAFLWITFGVIFMGAMQDFGALAISLRNRGRSIGDLAGPIISKRARVLFLLIVLFLAWIVLAVFAMVIANLFVGYPQTVVPINVEIILAVIIGVVIYRLKASLLLPSLFALVFLYVMVFLFADAKKENYLPSNWPVFSQMAESYVDSRVPPDPIITYNNSNELTGEELEKFEAHKAELEANNEERIAATRDFNVVWWLCALLLYSFIASVLPVWTLLQPRDYINSHQLFVALGLAYIGFFWAWPSFSAPALHQAEGAPPIFPTIFVLVACGAISGFHALIASGTTSKQVASFKDARAVGYGGMLAEGSLALLATMACAAGVSSVRYHSHYASFGGASGLTAKLGIFIEGTANMMGQLGIPASFATAVVTVMVISFAATTLDSATRIMRYIISELGEAYGLNFMSNRFLATGLAVGASLALALLAGQGGKGGLILWPLFGSINQLTAALALMVIAVYLHRTGKPKLYYLIPMIFVAIVTLVAMVREFLGHISPSATVEGPNVLLASISGIIIILDVWLMFEGAAALLGDRRKLAPDFLDDRADDKAELTKGLTATSQ